MAIEPVSLSEFLQTYPAVFESEAIRGVLAKVEKVAPYDIPVLLRGETGTGKEVMADIIHGLSPRREGPLIKVNCAAIPKELAEAHFFGSVKGSYTSSVRDRDGYLKMAHNGTLFLDELTETEYTIQGKLLRALETQMYRRVGGEKEEGSNFRVVWATNRDIGEAVQEKKLRTDLYYRISDSIIEVPTMRQREADVIPLAKFFLARARKEFKKEVKDLGGDALDSLLSYDWPGNVRQLRAVIRQAVIMCDGKAISAETIGVAKETVDKNGPFSVQTAEKKAIIRALEETGGNKLAATDLLEIGRQTLYNKIKAYGINDGSFVDPRGLSYRHHSGKRGNGAPTPGEHGNGKMDASEFLRGNRDLSQFATPEEAMLAIKSKREFMSIVTIVANAITESRSLTQAAKSTGTTPQRFYYVIKVLDLEPLLREAFGIKSVPRFEIDGARPSRLLLRDAPRDDVIDVEVISRPAGKASGRSRQKSR